jgi:WD40 repeat protein
MSRVILVVAALSSLVAGCAGTGNRLPHSLYYLDGVEDDAQVWRMESDGFTRRQITHEQAGVDEFAVSPEDGSLAFVIDGRLFLMDLDGTNRRLIADESDVDRHVDDPGFTTSAGSPEFSPDGRTLAYALDGLHLYDLDTGEDDHVLLDLGNLLGEPFVFAKEIYWPESWSPDGKKLLIGMAYMEGSTLAVMDMEAEQPFTRLRSHGPVCCSAHWTPDSRSVLVANAAYTTAEPGLWRYDVETGEETALIAGPREDGSRDYIGWPLQLSSGDLLFFHANLERLDPDVGIPLVMVRSDADGSNLRRIRSEAFEFFASLWSENGSLAVVVLPGEGEGSRYLALARTDESPPQVLMEGERIHRLTWGP